MCFSVNVAKFLKTPFLENTFEQLLLNNNEFKSERLHFSLNQGGLNEKGTELNFCSIFSISTFNKFYLFDK